MCCFSLPVKHVSATHIFARHMPNTDRQAIVYSMNVEIDDELAMVLPIPIAIGSSDDAVEMIDLSGYPKLFVDMREAFPEFLLRAKSRSILFSAQSASRSKLAVHDVGAFVASFVPSPRDFDRLDDRFRLSPEVFEVRHEYADYGFVVFQLKPNRGWFGKIKRQTIHPMAFTFPSRRPHALFYPTLHVHDGGHVPEKAVFDHSLYCQTDNPLLSETMPFETSAKPIGDHVDASRTHGLVSGADKCLRNVVMGESANEDHWYEPPQCAGAHVLRGEGPLFAFKLSASFAFHKQFGLVHVQAERWHHVARTKLDGLHAGLLEGLTKLTTERKDEWHLVSPKDEGLAKADVSGDHVYIVGKPGPSVHDDGKEVSVRVTFRTQTDVVEPQHIDLGFRIVPTPEQIVAIRSALNEIVVRSVA